MKFPAILAQMPMITAIFIITACARNYPLSKPRKGNSTTVFLIWQAKNAKTLKISP